jgi:hypothetical protein
LPVEFRISCEPSLLAQYYALRERCFRSDLGIVSFDGSEEDQDRQGQLFLAVQGGKCVGGARISNRVSPASLSELLELEVDRCCMWERFVIDPSVRTKKFFQEFCAKLVLATQENGYHYAMMLSSLRNARFYRLCHSSLGVGFEIYRQIPHNAEGCFAGLEHYLSVAFLREAQALRLAV